MVAMWNNAHEMKRNCKKLIVVPVMSCYRTGSPRDEANWSALLSEGQRRFRRYLEHIEEGVEGRSQIRGRCLVFRGGYSREDSTASSEGSAYLRVGDGAQSSGRQPGPAWFAEEYARDSYETSCTPHPVLQRTQAGSSA